MVAISRRFVFSVVLVGLTAFPVLAHELKVLASQLAMPKGAGKSTIYLSWGHRLPVDDLVDAATIERYDLLSPRGEARTLHKADLSLQANVVELTEAGIHQVVAHKKASVYTYVLDEDGARHLKRGPKTAHRDAKIDSASRYQQCAKAIVVVGKPAVEPPVALGSTMEIVPLEGPTSWTSTSLFNFRVLLEGKPLPSADVTATYVGSRPEGAWCYATTTNRAGEFTLRATPAGAWVIKVETQRLAQGKARELYDFEHYTATLSLEVQP